jgi:hypothetical protein
LQIRLNGCDKRGVTESGDDQLSRQQVLVKIHRAAEFQRDVVIGMMKIDVCGRRIMAVLKLSLPAIVTKNRLWTPINAESADVFLLYRRTSAFFCVPILFPIESIIV